MKRETKLTIPYGVYDRVNAGACVLEPLNHLHGYFKVAACPAVIRHDVKDEKRPPAENERTNHDRESSRQFDLHQYWPSPFCAVADHAVNAPIRYKNYQQGYKETESYNKHGIVEVLNFKSEHGHERCENPHTQDCPSSDLCALHAMFINCRVNHCCKPADKHRNRTLRKFTLYYMLENIDRFHVTWSRSKIQNFSAQQRPLCGNQRILRCQAESYDRVCHKNRYLSGDF